MFPLPLGRCHRQPDHRQPRHRFFEHTHHYWIRVRISSSLSSCSSATLMCIFCIFAGSRLHPSQRWSSPPLPARSPAETSPPLPPRSLAPSPPTPLLAHSPLWRVSSLRVPFSR